MTQHSQCDPLPVQPRVHGDVCDPELMVGVLRYPQKYGLVLTVGVAQYWFEKSEAHCSWWWVRPSPHSGGIFDRTSKTIPVPALGWEWRQSRPRLTLVSYQIFRLGVEILPVSLLGQA